jgi:hypothetical protein
MSPDSRENRATVDECIRALEIKIRHLSKTVSPGHDGISAELQKILRDIREALPI